MVRVRCGYNVLVARAGLRRYFARIPFLAYWNSCFYSRSQSPFKVADWPPVLLFRDFRLYDYRRAKRFDSAEGCATVVGVGGWDG